ncbi:hypothetical protein K469DRAFT_52208 [Zopfia rhizophila CBS 207.26]|uniref:Uncharacterized protein n=1 Tax=Zopfia rhizophila CBS 207.26 TaxID=1314779 RepID=A0A6A6D8Q5_9PEZI|nr:hypothetical protein K469DRAFT_52208 [Zopfia rhizophila CBS 207.26]
MFGQVFETLPTTHPGYLPPNPHAEYSYNPSPVTMEQPVGHDIVLHRCSEDNGCLEFRLKRFPKHIRGGIIIEIELVEGTD